MTQYGPAPDPRTPEILPHGPDPTPSSSPAPYVVVAVLTIASTALGGVAGLGIASAIIGHHAAPHGNVVESIFSLIGAMVTLFFSLLVATAVGTTVMGVILAVALRGITSARRPTAIAFLAALAAGITSWLGIAVWFRYSNPPLAGLITIAIPTIVAVALVDRFGAD
jgi:hypothetical protein